MKKNLLTATFFLFVATMLGACSVRTVSSSMSASAETAKLNSEYMRIWSRPLELGFAIDESVGENGRIVYIYPKPGQKVFKNLEKDGIDINYREKYKSENYNTVFGSNNFNFNTLSQVQQAAIIQVIKDYNLDGFYVTMIEQTTSTKETAKSVQKNFQVLVKGIALKIKDFGEVEKERVDKIRQEEAGNKEIHYYHD